MNEILCNRESLTPDQVFDRYYATSHLKRDLVVELLNHVAKELSLPVDKLLPGDRFAIELAEGRGNEWDSGYGILLFELRRLAKKRKKVIEIPIATVDDYLKEISKVY